MTKKGFLILDFGSQVTQLIARRYRDLGFYSEIRAHDMPLSEIIKFNPDGIILSGGPNSVYDIGSPVRDVKELTEVAPVFGICYGMQLVAQQYGGEVSPGPVREYGRTEINWVHEFSFLKDLDEKQTVWMSHGDSVKKVPENFKVVARSENSIAAMASEKERIFAVQFHPEVTHTEHGEKILLTFAKLCQAKKSWSVSEFQEELLNKVKEQVGSGKVLCALSGGVDSSVLGLLLTKALKPEQVHCVFVDTGFLRLNEYETVLSKYQALGLHVQGVDAKNLFFEKLKNVSDPELKRKTIGQLFIEIFEKNLPHNFQFLAQGTLYPDVIESVSVVGQSVTIKSHHNVGGLPEKMNLKLVEPFRFLFKDEVRALGQSLGLPEDMIGRHPFPGPGLAIRLLGEFTEQRLETLKKADAVFINYLREKNLYHKIWQAFCVLLPVRTVGVMGDGRTYDEVLALRAVTSIDGMTADWYEFQTSELKEISLRITNQVKGINRVVYDITSKPPATIEWE